VTSLQSGLTTKTRLASVFRTHVSQAEDTVDHGHKITGGLDFAMPRCTRIIHWRPWWNCVSGSWVCERTNPQSTDPVVQYTDVGFVRSCQYYYYFLSQRQTAAIRSSHSAVVVVRIRGSRTDCSVFRLQGVGWSARRALSKPTQCQSPWISRSPLILAARTGTAIVSVHIMLGARQVSHYRIALPRKVSPRTTTYRQKSVSPCSCPGGTHFCR